MTDDERRVAGEAMRRQVLSDSYVDSRRSGVTPFSQDLEDVITPLPGVRSGPAPASI